MKPLGFRQDGGVTALLASGLFVSFSLPAQAAPLASQYMNGAAPIAIAAGAVGFSIWATAWLMRWRRDGSAASEKADTQLAKLRAQLDDAQALLEGMPELTVRWMVRGGKPSVFGPAQAVLPKGCHPRDVLEFTTWLATSHAVRLTEHVRALLEHGTSFDLSVTNLENTRLLVTGRIVSDAAVLRVQPIAGVKSSHQDADEGTVQILAILPEPAWIRRDDGELIYTNAAYRKLADQAGVQAGRKKGLPDIFDAEMVRAQQDLVADTQGEVIFENAFKGARAYDGVLLASVDGMVGILHARKTPQAPAVQATQLRTEGDLGQIAGVINALHSPIAIFDGRRKLIQANSAYADLWGLDPDWLRPGMTEQAILDRLRTLGLLPAEIDYRAWRTEHLKSYGAQQPRETLWHLPDGRALNVTAVPASSSGGVIYAFEDMTAQFELKSRFKTLMHVQTETLGALTEAVAVFGTNGRLTLYNQRLSSIWKLPLNSLAGNPHIDEIGVACAQALPEDGALIWGDLKQSIIDLNPNRTDKSGRINRADGRLLDYATARLPDGQTLMTFVDVTESANYQRMLKERNEALETADTLKDAFVQNVSYELRSPLTNIIGFADLLASDSAGELNEKQKSYTQYIRASSATLGVLIDNILDLATVDAGIAQLDLEPQDISKLVEQAAAGLAATFSVDAGGDARPNLKVNIADDLPVFVADGTRVVQILYNLLSNAARFSEPGSEISLSVQTRGTNHISFTIEDEGSGISEEMKAALFQRFESQAGGGRQKGAGLGLAIVKTFVNLHGGTIMLEKRQPKGTRVIVNMPAIAVEASDAAE